MMSTIGRHSRRFPAVMRAAQKTGWPVAIGLGGFLAGLLMLAASLVLSLQAEGLGRASDAPAISERSESRAAVQARTGREPAFDAPRYETHLDDVALIFGLATEHGVILGPVDYRTEVQSTLPVVVRTLDLRLAEDYSRFKPFVADLLARVPHLYLQEIRIDRGSVETSKTQITLKLSLVYRINDQPFDPDGKSALLPATGSAQP